MHLRLLLLSVYVFTYMNTYVPTYIQTGRHTSTYLPTYLRVCSRIHAHTHISIPTCIMRTSMYTSMHACSRVLTGLLIYLHSRWNVFFQYTCPHACIRPFLRECIPEHPCIPTRIHWQAVPWDTDAFFRVTGSIQRGSFLGPFPLREYRSSRRPGSARHWDLGSRWRITVGREFHIVTLRLHDSRTVFDIVPFATCSSCWLRMKVILLPDMWRAWICWNAF